MGDMGDSTTYQRLYPDIWAAMKTQYGKKASIPPDVWTMFQDLQLLKFAKEEDEIKNVIWGLWAFAKAAQTPEGRRAAFVAKVLVQELPAKEHQAWFLLCRQNHELDAILASHPDPQAVLARGDEAAKSSVAVSVILEDVRRRWEFLKSWQRDVFYSQMQAFLSSKLREAALIVDVLEPSTFTFLFTKQLVRAGHRQLALEVFRKTPAADLFNTVTFGEPEKEHSYFELHTRFLMHGGDKEALAALEHLVEIGAYSDKSLDVFIHNVDLKDALLFVIDAVSCIRVKHSGKADQKALQKLMSTDLSAGGLSSDDGAEGEVYKPPPKPRRCFCFGRSAKAQVGAARLLWSSGVPHELMRILLDMYTMRDQSSRDYLIHQKDFQQAIEVVLLLSNTRNMTRFVERFSTDHHEALRECLWQWSKLYLIRLLEANRIGYKVEEVSGVVHGMEPWTWKPVEGRANYLSSDRRGSKDIAMVLFSFFGLAMFLDVEIISHFLHHAAGRSPPILVLEEFCPSDSHFYLAIAREVSGRMPNLYLPEVKMLMGYPGFFTYGMQAFLVGKSMDLPREVFRENMGFALLLQAVSRLVGFHGGEMSEDKLEAALYQISHACQGNGFCLNLMLKMFVQALKKPPLSFCPAGSEDVTHDMVVFTVTGLAACARRLREACDTVRTETVKVTLTRLVDAFLDTPARGWVNQFNALETVLFFLRLKEKEELGLAYAQFEAENEQAFKDDPEMLELMRETQQFFNKPFMDVSSVSDLCSVDVRTVMEKHKLPLGQDDSDTANALRALMHGKPVPDKDEVGDGETTASSLPKDKKDEPASPESVVIDLDDPEKKEVVIDLDDPEKKEEKKEGEADENGPNKADASQQKQEHHCVCGNAFMPDAIFCRKCGSKRNEAQHHGMAPADWNTIVEIATCTAESMKEKCNVPMLPHHTQMITLLMLATQVCRGRGKPKGAEQGVMPDSSKTVLARVGTGEGKSWLIGMLSSFVAKKGLKAHVIVDNPTLLERDYASMCPLFEKLGLSAGKREFNSGHQIIYCSGMDLEWDYMEKVKNGEDASFKHACMIVDEVDSLIVDDSVYKCYVDEYREGSDCCNQWTNEGRQGFPHPASWQQKIIDRCEGAYNEMRNKKDGRDFYVDNSQNWIWALDEKTTQVLRSAWFLWLELKRKQMMQNYQIRYMTRQSIVCKRSCFSSHKFIFGLTGSLGTEAEMKYTKQNFGASSFMTPPFLNTCRGERVSKAKCVLTKIEQTPEIQMNVTVEVAKGYSFSVPVVIVCRDADRVEQVVYALRAALPTHAEGDRNGEGIVHLVETPGQEAEFQQMVERATQPLEVPAPDGGKPLHYWRVTVTTPIGARGQDYRVSDELVDDKGGLMLILEFIPHSEREWIQFLGRTARHDHPGQYAVILNIDEYRTVLGGNAETALSEGNVTKRILDHVGKEGERKLQSTQQEMVRGAIMHKFTSKWFHWSERHKTDETRSDKFDKWVTLCEDFETMKPDQIVKAFNQLELEDESDEESSEGSEEDGHDDAQVSVPGEANMNSLIAKKGKEGDGDDASGGNWQQMLKMGQRFIGTTATAAPSSQPAATAAKVGNRSVAPPPPPAAPPRPIAVDRGESQEASGELPAMPDDNRTTDHVSSVAAPKVVTSLAAANSASPRKGSKESRISVTSKQSTQSQGSTKLAV